MNIQINTVGVWTQQANAGLVKELYAIARQHVTAVADYAGGFSAAGISLTEDAEVYKILFAPGRCTFNEGYEDSDQGVIYQPVMSMEIPRVEKEVSTWLKKNARRGFLLLWRDGNGQCYLSGCVDYPMFFNFSKNLASENKHGGSFTGQSPRPTVLLGGVLEDVLDMPEFSEYFSFDFNS